MQTQTITVKIENRSDRRFPIEVEGEILGGRVWIPVLVKAPTGEKTYAAISLVASVDSFDPERIYRKPATATVRNRNWPVVAVGAEAAAAYTNRY